jgi:RNA polymerase sigma-70 factor (ECF subfamily)
LEAKSVNIERPAAEITEAELIQWVRNGDSHAFTTIVQNYQNAVYNLCYRMLGNPGDAEDAAQETFLRAYRAIHRYDPNRKFSTWILSIATNYSIDQLRKRRLFTLSLDAIPYLDVRDTNVGPEGSLLMGERQKKIQHLLDTLKPKDRAAIVMRYWYDYSYDEIGETLNLTNSAVKSRLHRARQALAEEWTEQEAQTVHQTIPSEFAI